MYISQILEKYIENTLYKYVIHKYAIRGNSRTGSTGQSSSWAHTLGAGALAPLSPPFPKTQPFAIRFLLVSSHPTARPTGQGRPTPGRQAGEGTGAEYGLPGSKVLWH